MKIAYLIVTHRNPALLGKVIETLGSEDDSFFIHVDAKSDFAPFAQLEGERVHFTKKREPVYWGEFSQVTAALTLIEEALASPHQPDYLMLFTGSEFPIRSRDYIHRHLEMHRGDQFITLSKMPAPGKPLDVLRTVRFPSARPMRRFLFRALAKLGLGKRDYRRAFGSLEPYAGIGWWALTAEACREIRDFARRDLSIAPFLAKTHAPDETYMHTIIGNSPHRSRARRNFLYEDWSAGVLHPRMIDEEHLAAFAAETEFVVQDENGTAEILFARKYSDARLDLVDKTIAMSARKDETLTAAAS